MGTVGGGDGNGGHARVVKPELAGQIGLAALPRRSSTTLGTQIAFDCGEGRFFHIEALLNNSM
jgi:hypothetical protein